MCYCGNGAEEKGEVNIDSYESRLVWCRLALLCLGASVTLILGFIGVDML